MMTQLYSSVLDMGADTVLIHELVLDHQLYKIKSSAVSKYEQYIE